MIAPPRSHPLENYLDLDDGFQIVIYSKEELKCKADIEITGEVMEIVGGGEKGSKLGEEEHYEYHIKVNSWKCL